MRKGPPGWLTAGGFVLAVVAALLYTSTPRAVGDAGEYLVTARRLAGLQGPSFSAAEKAGLDPGIKWVEVRGGRFETVHFWFYPLLAVPAVWAADRMALSTEAAFAATNLALYGGAAVLALRQVSAGAALLILLSPIVWWLDKPHPEVFTFSLLAVVALTARSAPTAGLVCAAVASTQNPPIALLVPLLLVLYPGARLRKPWIIAAVWIASLHPIYYLWKIGQTTALVDGDIRIPTLTRYATVLWDVNLGLIPNAPFIVIAGVAALVLMRGWTARRRDAALAVCAAAWFLFSFSQAININHGGTPSMSRYALWLLPLAFTILPPRGESPPRGARLFTALVAASVVWSVVFFHPRRMEGHLRPTRAAMFQWTRLPAWQNPVPEVFAERLRGRDAVNELAGTPGCEKVLIQAGTWPHPCVPQATPEACQQPDAWCYGNRNGSAYEFVQVPRRGGYRLGWPLEKGR